MTAMSEKTNRIPAFLYPLFWEHNPEEIDILRHSDSIMARIMERGTWEAMRWLRKTYEVPQIVSFLERRGRRILPLRELNYWALIAGVSEEKRRVWLKEAGEKHDVWSNRYAH